MKKIFTLILILSSFWLTAQKAADFTLTDLNGEEFNLYQKLEENKAVLIDFSTTWCGPCWSLHKSGLLDEVYEELGPNGEDVLDVIWIESDPATNDDCLKGLPTCNNSTQGDWVTGTTFRMFNPTNNDVPSAYPVNGYPTVVIVSALDGSIILNKNFPTKEEIKNAVHLDGYVYDKLELEILEFTTPPSVCETASASVKIRNKSKQTSQNTKVELLVDDKVVQTKTIEGDFTQGQVETINFTDIPLTEKISTLKVQIVIEDEVSTNNKSLAVVGKKSFDNKIEVFIKENTLQGKTQYQVIDGSGNVIFESGSIYSGKDHKKEIIVPELGCTSIVFSDSFNKGISGKEDALQITDSQGKKIYSGELDLKSGTVAIGYNTSMYSSIEDIAQLDRLELTPNPVHERFMLEMEMTESANVKAVIMNNLGQVVYEKDMGVLSVGEHTQVFDTENYESGLYFVQIMIEGKTEIRKFVKK